jgi:tetratricopeptide (TPR) repeat protein
MLSSTEIPQVVREDSQPVRTIGIALDAALNGYRAGTLGELLRQYPGSQRWLETRYLNVIYGTAGDALPTEARASVALAVLLEWAVTQLRPDRAASFEIHEPQHWLERTSWRPAIAVMCHYGFAQVPEFRQRYYHHPDESPADHLCGLWNVGQSTFYRYLEKGERLMSKLLHEQRLDGRHTSSLREYAKQVAYTRLNLVATDQQQSWHAKQTTMMISSSDYASAVWHSCASGDLGQTLTLFNRFAMTIANSRDADQYVKWAKALAESYVEHIQVLLVEADIRRIQNVPNLELSAYEQALQLAVSHADPLQVGTIYARLGKFFELRNIERAFAYYQDCIASMSPVIQEAQTQNAVTEIAHLATYADTHLKLAWLYILRNDPRSESLLNAIKPLIDRISSDALIGTFHQVAGEYWRRSGQLDLAIEHKYRALNAFERLQDLDGQLKTKVNLGLIYTELKRYEKALTYYQAVLDISSSKSVTVETLISAYSGIGVCKFYCGEFSEAISYYENSLKLSESNNLRLNQARMHYNLAEAYFALFKRSGNPQDEELGDKHARAGIDDYLNEGQYDYADSLQRVKQLILQGQIQAQINDRMLTRELAANYDELSEVDKHRAMLATPAPPAEHIRAHLAIANSYLAISAKEREAALALIDKHGLHDQFADAFEQLRSTYERELTREQKVTAQWKQITNDLLNDERRGKVLNQLFNAGAINKSSYAELCSVGLATASKHLGRLSELGLLVQTGKGPSTRYLLPKEK